MVGTLQLSPDQLAQLVEAVMGQNGLQMSTLALYDKAGNLVDYNQVVITYKPQALRVRSVPEEDSPGRMNDIRSLLYPEMPKHAGQSA